jgi:hypothetical protein
VLASVPATSKLPPESTVTVLAVSERPSRISTVLPVTLPPIVSVFATAFVAEICAVPPLSTIALSRIVGTPNVQLLDVNQLPVVPCQEFCCPYKVGDPIKIRLATSGQRPGRKSFRKRVGKCTNINSIKSVSYVATSMSTGVACLWRGWRRQINARLTDLFSGVQL